MRLTRRRLLGLGIVGAAGVYVGAAFGVGTKPSESSLMRGKRLGLAARASSEGRLTARPRKVNDSGAPGLQQLGLGDGRDGFVYVPASYTGARPAPLVVMLHGAGGAARQTVPLLQQLADRWGMILLVPDSRRQTWDVIEGGYGEDVAFIDRALEQTFSRYAIEPGRISVAGFSDGASYALSLGVMNGDLFTHVMAFSPGFMAPVSLSGSPSLFISHGTQDRVLPIEVCSRRIVPQLKQKGYRLQYREFEGPHTVPHEVAVEAVDWFLKDELRSGRG